MNVIREAPPGKQFVPDLGLVRGERGNRVDPIVAAAAPFHPCIADVDRYDRRVQG
jgi:hypothetical protein